MEGKKKITNYSLRGEMWSSQGRITPLLGHISVFYEVLN